MVMLGGEVTGAVAAANGQTERGSRISAGVASIASSLFGEPDPQVEEATPLVQHVNLKRLPALMIPPPAEEEVKQGVLCAQHGALGVDAPAGLLEQLSNAVPRRYGDTGSWHLLHSTSSQGTSLSHLLRSAAGAGPCVLLIRDTCHRVFGAFVTELRESHRGSTSAASRTAASDTAFYGTGESFLFALGSLTLPAPPDASLRRTHSQSISFSSSLEPPPVAPSPTGSARDQLALLAFRWTKRNDYFATCTEVDRSLAGSSAHVMAGLQLAIGAGGGGGGLVLGEDLGSGSTGFCETFGNPPLTNVAAIGASSQQPRSGGGTGAGTPTKQSSGSGVDEAESQPFVCEAVELWGVDEHACRKLPWCKDHIALRTRGAAGP